jgi:hypothetical protein
MTPRIKIVAFWVTTLCSVLGGYQRFGAVDAFIFQIEIKLVGMCVGYEGSVTSVYGEYDAT